MKKAWRIKADYGSYYVVLYAENGKELDYYKLSTFNGMIMPKVFSFADWMEDIPQGIVHQLNAQLKEKGEYTPYINMH